MTVTVLKGYTPKPCRTTAPSGPAVETGDRTVRLRCATARQGPPSLRYGEAGYILIARADTLRPRAHRLPAPWPCPQCAARLERGARSRRGGLAAHRGSRSAALEGRVRARHSRGSRLARLHASWRHRPAERAVADLSQRPQAVDRSRTGLRLHVHTSRDSGIRD